NIFYAREMLGWKGTRQVGFLGLHEEDRALERVADLPPGGQAIGAKQDREQEQERGSIKRVGAYHCGAVTARGGLDGSDATGTMRADSIVAHGLARRGGQSGGSPPSHAKIQDVLRTPLRRKVRTLLRLG